MEGRFHTGKMTRKDWIMVLATLVPTLLTILGVTFYLGGRFSSIDGRFNTMEARFDAMEVRLDAMEVRFDERFNKIEGDLTDLKNIIINPQDTEKGLIVKFTKIEGRIENIEGTLSQILSLLQMQRRSNSD